MKLNSSVIIQAALTGMGIGFIATTASVISISGLEGVGMELLVWLVASALFGIISALVFYTPNSLTLPAAMILHFIGCAIVAITAVVVCGYFGSVKDIICSFLPVFLVIYAAIYLVCLLIMKHNEKLINQALREE